jgi:hypothetical protein
MEEGGPNGQPGIGEGTEIQPIVDEVRKRPLGPTQRLVRHSWRYLFRFDLSSDAPQGC